jgi:hypothetical protein
VGLFADLAETAARFAQPAGEPVRPESDRHALYQPLVERYIQMQDLLAGFYGQP